MAQIRKLDLVTEIKCSPDKIFDVFKNGISLMPRISPDKLRSIEVLEGDGKSVGSVRLWNYMLGGSVVAKDKIDAIDVENKSITFAIIGGEITKYFTSYKATIQVISRGTKNMVKWTVEYEKMNEDVPDPYAQVEFLVTMSKEVDAYLINLKP